MKSALPTATFFIIILNLAPIGGADVDKRDLMTFDLERIKTSLRVHNRWNALLRIKGRGKEKKRATGATNANKSHRVRVNGRMVNNTTWTGFYQFCFTASNTQAWFCFGENMFFCPRCPYTIIKSDSIQTYLLWVFFISFLLLLFVCFQKICFPVNVLLSSSCAHRNTIFSLPRDLSFHVFP